MEYYNQAPESYYNQESESFYNQEPESFYTTAANVNVNNNNNNTTTTYYNRAAESFFIDEMRKLETEKALWKRDEQVLTKEVSRLNDRIQIEVSLCYAVSGPRVYFERNLSHPLPPPTISGGKAN